MKFPSSVHVGYKTIKLLLTSRKSFKDYGEYDPEKHRIRVRKSQNPVELTNTVLHEVLHAIWDVHAIRVKEGEERVVTLLANGLTQTLRSSPELRKWLFDALEKQETK